MRTAALVCRSYYSLLRAAVSVQRFVRGAKEYGYEAVALADVNSMYGAVDLFKAAEQENIKAIIGVEILTDAQNAILLAENKNGYKNLCRITTAKNLDENFSLIERLSEHNNGLICICNQPHLLEKLKGFFPKDCLFAACEDARDAHRAKASGVEPVACTNFNCLENSDIVTTKLLAGIRRLSAAGAGRNDSSGFNKLVPERQFRLKFRNCPHAIVNSEKIAQRCNFQLLKGGYFLPEVKLGKGRNADTELAKLSHIGLAKMYKPVSKEVVKRLQYELAVIRKNKFSDYFLVVHTIVNFAKQNNTPVDVRGSAAGSLVSYVLGFTRICPVENNLYFERFMNPGRRDCPDIDIDLCWRRRDEVIKFCYENWGCEYVAMLSNINRYRRRNAIRDTGRFLGLQPGQINQLVSICCGKQELIMSPLRKQGSRAKKLDSRFRGNDKRCARNDKGCARNDKMLVPQQEIVDKKAAYDDSVIYKLAERLIHIPRHLAVHCGGIVITPSPVRDLAPLERAAKGVIVTQYDKDAAEAAGLIKIDLLGNRALSTVNEAIDIITQPAKKLNIDTVNPADEKTAAMLSSGRSLGVFQCESPGMRQLLRGLKVKNKKDVAIALSLIMPGPASGGMKSEFIKRHIQKKPFQYLHPKMKEVLGDTYGVMLYQEDVMRIAVEVAGYSVADADRFRSEVSKKVSASRLQRQYEDFVYSRAGEAGIDRRTAEAVWEQILKFAAYSHCKAHVAVYANIAWHTAFLKAHYPRQFYTSLFNNHHGMYPLRVYVWEAVRHGITILPPHVNASQAEWSMQGRAVRAGLNIIKGLSYSTIDAVIEQRKIKLFADIDDLRRRVTFRRPELQNLIHVGACDGLGKSRPQMLMRLHFTPLNPDQLLLFDIYDNPAQPILPEYDRLTKLKAEVDVTGIPFSMHPALLLRAEHTPAAGLAGFINKEVTVAGFVAAARRAKTNDGKIMGFVTLEDSSGLAEITFFPGRIDKYRYICSAKAPVWIKGKVTEHLSSITIEAHNCGMAA